MNDTQITTACDICEFLNKKPLQNQILTTQYWTVGAIPNQPYLGRALITLLTHKESVGQLSAEEWFDFAEIMKKLEPAYRQAFGANPLNIGNFMNHAFKTEIPHPHVHWHIFPRYKNPVELAGQTFTDGRYGKFYDDAAVNIVDDSVVKEIVARLQQALAQGQ